MNAMSPITIKLSVLLAMLAGLVAQARIAFAQRCIVARSNWQVGGPQSEGGYRIAPRHARGPGRIAIHRSPHEAIGTSGA